MSAMDPAYAWYGNSWLHLAECPMTYNYVLTFMRLLECEIIIYRNAVYAENMPEVNQELRSELSKKTEAAAKRAKDRILTVKVYLIEISRYSSGFND